ncbi:MULTISPECIES: hypothetical protein [Halolamina]|uniref:Uncharacterized protein n=1 Tax=Halolamina pelagica TaxID=699431 RepID=A0A1I5MC12_9EURY|nr:MULTISPECIES: hypothetical protein [Halolamina]NHX35938.1 hypothetical protein [Halolamina sp. R1-12]SFP06486.1 hypothetical protein SAMN05216277_101179 [Halolamina pelagica]
MSELDFDREIRVRLVFAVVAAVLGIGVAVFTDVSEWIAFGIVILLGIVAPRAYLYFGD